MAMASRDIPVRFALATQADDAALRTLLRENPMRGRISISLEREPDYFAAAAIEGEHQTIVAYEGDRLVCAGNVSVRERFINGKPMRVGYLGGLRLDASCRGRASIVRRGYEMFRELHGAGGPPIYLSSIAEDNEPARRLLEAGIRGMPTYRFLGKLVTMVFRRPPIFAVNRSAYLPPRDPVTPWGRPVEGSEIGLCAIAAYLRRALADYQLAPVWSEADLASSARCPNLRADDFRVARAPGGEVLACLALWDQRNVKQSVVRGYGGMLRWLRAAVNPIARLLGGPRLPRIGQTISSQFISHLVGGGEQSVHWLMSALKSSEIAAGIDYLVAAFDERDPRVESLNGVLRWARRYVTRLYAVHWDDGAELAASLDDRLLAPEVAIL